MPRPGPLRDRDMGIEDRDLLVRHLLAGLQGTHQLGGVGEVWQRCREVEPQGAVAIPSRSPFQHYAEASCGCCLGRLKRGGRAAELRHPDIEDSRRLLAHDGGPRP